MSNYTQQTISSSACPWGNAGKHVMLAWHPVKKRVYNFGGDWNMPSASATAFGQPSGTGATLTTALGTNYEFSEGLRNDMYSIDPYAIGTVSWRLEHTCRPQNLGTQQNPIRESRPGRPDQVSLVWDPMRSKFWCIYTSIRAPEFIMTQSGYGVGTLQEADKWANGELDIVDGPNRVAEPYGTWSWIPSANGDVGNPGTFTYETDAAVICRNDPTFYGGASGQKLYTNHFHDYNNVGRIGNWAWHTGTGKIWAFGGYQTYTTIFSFDPTLSTSGGNKIYKYYMLQPSGYSLLCSCNSFNCFVGDWMYGVAWVQQGNTRTSRLIAVNVTAINGLANGASIPNNTSYWRSWTLPFSLTNGGVWESSGSLTSAWVQEHAGVMPINDKVVVCCSYNGLVDQGTTRLGIFNTGTQQWTLGEVSPESGLAASSWVALPDTGEIYFGITTSGYTNLKMWRYFVEAPAIGENPPNAPASLRIVP